MKHTTWDFKDSEQAWRATGHDTLTGGGTGSLMAVGGSDAADARLSPVFSPPASLAALPPTLLVVGDAEVMLSDSTEFAA